MGFSQLRIGVRLGLGFFAIVALAVLLGAIALVQMREITSSAQYLGATVLPRAEQLGDLRVQLNRIRRLESGLVTARSLPEVSAFADQLPQRRERVQQIQARYEPMLQNDAERTLFQTYQASKIEYLQLQARLLELAKAVDFDSAESIELSSDELVQTFAGASESSFSTANSALEQLQEQNTLLADHARTAASQTASRAQLWILGALGLCALLALCVAVAITRSVTRPVQQAVAVARSIAAGDLATPLPAAGKDEMGVLLQALADMRDHLAQVVTGVRANAEGVATASAEIAYGNSDLSIRTERQASALEETAASMEQLGSTVHQNAESARHANQLALAATKMAEQGGAAVAEVVQTMKGINDSSRKVADILGVIDAIAFQTNILALNAAVEAARAGEQGRGFAVVASEVRTLAQRSADAAKEVRGLISTSMQRVEQGSAQVDQTGTAMSEMVKAIRNVTDLVGAISAASTEQSAGVAQVGEAVMQMDQATQQNAALVEQMAASSSGLSQQAQALVAAVAVFSLGDQEGAHSAASAASATRLGAPSSGTALQLAAA